MTLQNLIRLTEFLKEDQTKVNDPSLPAQIDALRASLPENVLRRFDHLVERERLPVAKISQFGACGSCHLKLTPGDVLRVRHATATNDAVLCPFCGCFLYAPAAISELKEATKVGA